MPEKLLDISQAKQFLDAKSSYWDIWYAIESKNAKEIWVDKSSDINSLMTIEESHSNDASAGIHIEADSEEALFALLSVLESGKTYFATIHKEWMWSIFEKEFNAWSLGRQYHYSLIKADFTPYIYYPVREFSMDDEALIDTFPDEDGRDRAHRHFHWNSKFFGIVENEQLISYVATWNSGNRREIDWIYTRPDKRKQGYGTSIASAASEYIFQTEGQKVTATVDEDNFGSLKIWKKLGFHCEGATTYYLFVYRK